MAPRTFVVAETASECSDDTVRDVDAFGQTCCCADAYGESAVLDSYKNTAQDGYRESAVLDSCKNTAQDTYRENTAQDTYRENTLEDTHRENTVQDAHYYPYAIHPSPFPLLPLALVDFS